VNPLSRVSAAVLSALMLAGSHVDGFRRRRIPRAVRRRALADTFSRCVLGHMKHPLATLAEEAPPIRTIIKGMPAMRERTPEEARRWARNWRKKLNRITGKRGS
jgi:hypothetical protein